MSISSIGDLAQSLQLRRDNARLTLALNRVTSEISTGQVQDITKTVRGDFSLLASLERGMTRLASFETVQKETALEVDARQSTLGTLREISQGVSNTLLLVESTQDATLMTNAARDAADRFDSALGLLNNQIGGRSLFSGQAVSGPAIAQSETIMAALELAIVTAGATTPAEIESVVDGWFSVGGDFDTVAYLGSDQRLDRVNLSDTETTTSPPTAEDVRLRGTLAALALGTLVDRGALSGSVSDRGALLQSAGERLLQSDKSLVEMQAEIGTIENKIERAKAETNAEFDALQLARSEIVSVDPFEAASELQAIEGQLQALYTITGRLSRLTLTEYI